MLTIEPRLSQAPSALHGAWRNLQYLGGLLQAQPDKETQFDYLAQTLVQRRQFVQRIVQRDQVRPLYVRDPFSVGERYPHGIAAIFLRPPPPCFAYEDAA